MDWPATVGEGSLTAAYVARSAGGPLAVGEMVHLAVEYGDDGGGGAVRVPDRFREAVASFQGEPDV